MDAVKSLLAQGKAAEAVEQATRALDAHPQDADVLLLRSTAYTRTNQNEAALADAELAVQINNGTREAQLRRAISLWRLKRYGEAKGVLPYLGTSAEDETWKKMILQQPDPPVKVERVPGFDTGSLNASPRTSVASVHASTGTPIPPLPALPNIATASMSEELSPSSVSPNSTALPAEAAQPRPPRVDWYQSTSVVHVVLYRKDLDPAVTTVSIEEHEISVRSDGFTWMQSLGPAIKPQESSFELNAFKVEFSLAKSDFAPWKSLEDDASPASATPSPGSAPAPASAPRAPPAAPGSTTSYSKWDAIDDDEDSKEAEGDPNVFFQKLFKDASPEAQRAMMKSFSESNGTVLSTNWDEVKQGKVATQPPKDSVPKQW